MSILEEADEYFRTTPNDVDVDEDIDDLLKDFEMKHLTESERKLINSKDNVCMHKHEVRPRNRLSS